MSEIKTALEKLGKKVTGANCSGPSIARVIDNITKFYEGGGGGGGSSSLFPITDLDTPLTQAELAKVVSSDGVKFREMPFFRTGGTELTTLEFTSCGTNMGNNTLNVMVIFIEMSTGAMGMSTVLLKSNPYTAGTGIDITNGVISVDYANADTEAF